MSWTNGVDSTFPFQTDSRRHDLIRIEIRGGPGECNGFNVKLIRYVQWEGHLRKLGDNLHSNDQFPFGFEEITQIKVHCFPSLFKSTRKECQWNSDLDTAITLPPCLIREHFKVRVAPSYGINFSKLVRVP